VNWRYRVPVPASDVSKPNWQSAVAPDATGPL
jgi:hypothetical protein